ncbi:MAG: F0F1 ATP synthase subunit B [Deltaproteobacteria bacterium]
MLGLLFASDLVEVQPGMVFWTLVTFVCLAALLAKFAWKPVLRLVEEREKSIHGNIEGAKRDRDEAQKLLDEHRRLVGDARREAAEAMKKAMADAEAARLEMTQKTRKEAEDILANARRQIEEDKTKAQAELRGVVVDLAIDVATKILGEQLGDQARQRVLLERYVEEIPKREKLSA